MRRLLTSVMWNISKCGFPVRVGNRRKSSPAYNNCKQNEKNVYFRCTAMYFLNFIGSHVIKKMWASEQQLLDFSIFASPRRHFSAKNRQQGRCIGITLCLDGESDSYGWIDPEGRQLFQNKFCVLQEISRVSTGRDCRDYHYAYDYEYAFSVKACKVLPSTMI